MSKVGFQLLFAFLLSSPLPGIAPSIAGAVEAGPASAASIQKTCGDLAQKHPSVSRAAEWLLKAISEAKAGKNSEAVNKHLVSLSLLEQWADRPDYYSPPTASLPHKRAKGEKLDLMVYGPARDYASFPSISRCEDRIILNFDAQPLSVLARIGIHPHEQVLAGPCWTVSEDGGNSWRTTRKRPEYGKVVHAPRSLAAFHPKGWVSSGNLRHPFGDHFKFSPFDYAKCADGSLLAGGKGFPDPGKPQAIVFAGSADNGRTWQFLSQIAATDVLGGYTEPALHAGKDGRIICVIRTKWDGVDSKLWPPDVRGSAGKEPGYGWYFYQAESTDHGKTWSALAKTGVWGHPANILRLNDGKVLMVYGHRKPPWSVRAIVSDDDGRTWDMKSMRILHEFKPALNDFGYPVATQLPDGTIVCAYYGYSTQDTTRWASPHGVFVSLFDERWLMEGAVPDNAEFFKRAG